MRYSSEVAPIHVGTSGWSYPTGKGTWNGVFYPSRRPGRFDELAYYAEHFDTVEVNSTFYRMPEAAHAASWRRRTPAKLARPEASSRSTSGGRPTWRPCRRAIVAPQAGVA